MMEILALVVVSQIKKEGEQLKKKKNQSKKSQERKFKDKKKQEIEQWDKFEQMQSIKEQEAKIELQQQFLVNETKEQKTTQILKLEEIKLLDESFKIFCLGDNLYDQSFVSIISLQARIPFRIIKVGNFFNVAITFNLNKNEWDERGFIRRIFIIWLN